MGRPEGSGARSSLASTANPCGAGRRPGAAFAAAVDLAFAAGVRPSGRRRPWRARLGRHWLLLLNCARAQAVRLPGPPRRALHLDELTLAVFWQGRLAGLASPRASCFLLHFEELFLRAAEAALGRGEGPRGRRGRASAAATTDALRLGSRGRPEPRPGLGVRGP